MPSEKLPTRLRATLCSPTRSITSTTRQVGIPWVCAMASRWWYADRPVWIARASSIVPTSHSGAASWRYWRPLTVAVPEDGASRPTIIAHGRRLAGAVGPQEAGDATGPDLEAQVIDGQRVAVALAQMRDIDHRRR